MKYSRMFMFLVLMAAAAASFGAYNAAKPADNEYVADVPALVRENFRAIKDDAIVNAGTVSGLSVGNASGNIPRSNGTLNTNLNADLLDGFHASAFNASDALNLRLNGSRAMTGALKFSGNYGILQSTSDGADNGLTSISGGGGLDVGRGGHLKLFGNEYSGAGGQVCYHAGNVSGGDHVFYTGAGTERFRIGYNGTTKASLLSVGATPIFRDSTGYFSNAIEIGVGDGDTYPIKFQIEQNSETTYLSSNLYYSAGGFKCYDVNRAAASINMKCNNADSSIQFLTYNVNNTTPSIRAMITKLGNLLIDTTTDDGANKLQVNGSVFFNNGANLPNNVGYRCKNTSGTVKSIAYIDSSDVTRFGTTSHATRIDSNGTLTHNGNTVWTAASDGAGSGLDADLVQGVNLAPQEKTAQTMGAAGWFRIAQSVIGIGRNHGIFDIDWATSGYHGQATLAAGNHYGAAGGTGLNLLGLDFYPSVAPTGITKARVVYHTAYSGNYAYLEVYADRNLSNAVSYRITQATGWTLINATAGSIPSGYTSQEIAFVDCNLNHGRMAWKTPGTYSWVCPPGVFKVWIDAVGAGGGGGGGNGTILGGGGGAGGSAKDYVVTVTPGTSYTVVVGTGGQGGISSSNSGYGGAGTNTTFGGETVGAGGWGAGDLINASEGGYGGLGGTSKGGNGEDGGGGKAGSGGNSMFGGGGWPSVTPLGAGGHGSFGPATRAASGGNGFLSLAW